MANQKVAFIGDLETVIGFKTLGASVFDVSAAEELPAVLNEVSKPEFGVVFITDQVEEWLGDDLEKLEKTTVVLAIPSCKTRNDMGFKALEKLVEKSIGISKLFDKV